MNDNFAHRAADWDSPEKTKMTKIFVSEMLKHIQLQKKWKAIEIGAGTGLVGLQILPYISQMVFEDTSAAMLDVLKQKLDKEQPVEIVHGEIFEYHKQDIDLAFSCMAFHHLPSIEHTLDHLAKITKPDAYVVVGDLLTEDGSFHHFEPIPHKGFDLDILSEQFRNAGFNVLTTKHYHTLKRERTPGMISDYEQFILIAKNSLQGL
jgi:Methylase involved in ubiquinone/menaquinone biosynthesis